MGRILIVGGGVGGLCAARAVAAAGHEAIVLERASTDTAVGAGLLLWPNAVAALDRLGVGGEVRQGSAVARRAVLRTPQGARLAVIDTAAIGRRAGAPMLLIERSELHRILAGTVTVRFDSEVTAVDHGRLELAGGGTLTADAVIGADGINSAVRSFVAGEHPARDTGFTVIRGIATSAIEEGTALEVWGQGELIGAAALAGQRTYWFYEAPTRRFEGREPLDVLEAGGWPEPFPRLAAATAPESVLINRIRTLPELGVWSRGTTALLGDAAHAMAPNLGQGAAQAIEDAAAIKEALLAHDDFADTFTAYVALRRDRAVRIQRESARMARLALSRSQRLRHLAMRAVPDVVRSRLIERLLLP
jgi:2-polyprenyl-6-methoxyphenol hydroxylase-like FAD-dependent oxidoreductase